MSRSASNTGAPSARIGPSTSARTPPFASDRPISSNFASNHFVLGGGVAIFHVASSRVVLCHHSRDKYWFLPKGRRDVGESIEQGAEREGFEETGYRNRLLPLPVKHLQPQPRIPADPRFSAFSVEPVFSQLYPQSQTSQYLCFWYIAETVPPAVEEQLNAAEAEAEASGDSIFGAMYQYPPAFPATMTLQERVAMERGLGPGGKGNYEPVHHPNKGMDPEEALYESHLMTVPEALEKLAQQPVLSYVVKTGWDAVVARLAMNE